MAGTAVRPPVPPAARGVGSRRLRPGRRLRAARRVPWPAAACVAAALSLGVAWIHFAYMASHFREWWAYGTFFLAAGAGQALFAPLILHRPRRWLVLVGIAGNCAIVGMYVLSRTAGPPLGPHAHAAERAGAVDLATTAAEVAIVGVLLTMLGATARRRVANVLLAAGALLWLARLTGRLP
jgi:hypothetical protein